MKYSITRALAERKVLIKRHEKAVRELTLIAVQRGNLLQGSYTHIKPEDFSERAKSMMQSILSLEARIDEIKYRIDQSNLVTMIKIGSREMTIQEALVLKNSITLKKERLKKMKSLYTTAKIEYNDAVEENRKKIDKEVSENTAAILGSSSKPDTGIEERIKESVERTYSVVFIDPLSLEQEIAKLESEIEEFESNVDYALSESNSQTFIEITD